LDEEQLSDKDKKKALKAKAKAAMAAATEKEEDAAAADKKAALEEELAAKKAAEGASAETVQVEASPSAEKAAEATPEAAPEAAPASEAAPEAAPAAPVERKPVEYSTPELAADAAKHKEGLDDPTRPHYQNPLHHNNPDSSKIFREDFESQEAFENASLPAPPLDLGDGIAAPEYLHALADEVVSLSMLEMNELVNKIADHYGFHEGMLSPDDDGAEGADDDDEAEVGGAAEEQVKTVFDIKLVAFDAKAKIKVIKEVRALAGLGLKEAKELVESAPKVVHKDVKKEEADEIKAKLEELGATVEIV
jgi:large subunit ribosomal protein L7/L12